MGIADYLFPTSLEMIGDLTGRGGVDAPFGLAEYWPDWLKLGSEGYESRGFNKGGLVGYGNNVPEGKVSEMGVDWGTIGEVLGGHFLPALGVEQPTWASFGSEGREARGFNIGGLVDGSSGADFGGDQDSLGSTQPLPLMGNSPPDWLNISDPSSVDEERGFFMGGMMDSAANADWRSTMAAGRNEYPDWLKVGTTEGYESRGFNMGGLAEELGGAIPQGAESMGLGAVPGMLEESGGFGPGVSEGMELPEGASLKDIADMMSREQVAAVIEEVRMALSGEHPQGEQLLSIVAQMFGPEFIQQISQTFAAASGEGVQGVQGVGEERGFNTGGLASDGMSDSIPASLGNERIAVSEGEYIVPAREVASLGNGSSNAGGRELDRMVQEIRAAATGSPDSAPPIDPRSFLGGSIA